MIYILLIALYRPFFSECCQICLLNSTIYSLCNGSYTIESATTECLINGYQIVEDYSIDTILSAFKLV